MTTHNTSKTAQLHNAAYLRVKGVAERCCVSERTVRDWQRRGILAYLKPARKVTLFAVADVDRAMQRFRVQAVGEGTET